MLFSLYRLHNKQCNAGNGSFKYVQNYSCFGGGNKLFVYGWTFRLTWWQHLSRAWGTWRSDCRAWPWQQNKRQAWKIHGELSTSVSTIVACVPSVVEGEKNNTICLSFLSCGDRTRFIKPFIKYWFFSHWDVVATNQVTPISCCFGHKPSILQIFVTNFFPMNPHACAFKRNTKKNPCKTDNIGFLDSVLECTLFLYYRACTYFLS